MVISTGNTKQYHGSVSELPATYSNIEAIGDLNADGLADLVLLSDRAQGHQLMVALATGPGKFAEAAIFDGLAPIVIDPHVLIGDFTGDGRADLIVYEAGTYDWSSRLTLGGRPVLYVGGEDGKMRASSALTDAIAPFVRPSSGNFGGYQVDLTMGVKDIATADIDGDGDLDIWVESSGSRNMTSHFMVNNGAGLFSIDLNNRVSRETLFGPGSADYWRYGFANFFDVNADGSPDLVLQQIRDNHPSHLSQSSFVLINDGKGNFPQSGAKRLPLPDFFSGYTSANASDVWDVDADGRMDIVLVHTRNDDVTPQYEPAWTGNFVQLLMQQVDGSFIDKTAQYFGDQSNWSSDKLQPHEVAHRVSHADINFDGVMDIVMGYDFSRPSDTLPLLFLGRRDGSFAKTSADFLTGGDIYFGEGAWSWDLNQDGVLDFIHLDRQPGPNGQYEIGADDFSALVAQLGKQSAVTDGPLTLRGSASDDVLQGGFGNDRLFGYGGNDAIDGGAGIDTAVFSGARVSYTVTRVGETVIVSALSGGDGTDRLTNVERLKFSDINVALDITANAGIAYRLYQAAFDRAPDLSGLGYQIAALDGGLSPSQVSQNFISSPEFSRTYGALNNIQFVDQLYQNVLGRVADISGLEYHTGRLSNSVSRADILIGFSESPENQAALIGVIQNGMAYT